MQYNKGFTRDSTFIIWNAGIYAKAGSLLRYLIPFILFYCVSIEIINKKWILFFSERTIALTDDTAGPWPAKRRRSSLYKNMGLLCCVSRPNYLWKSIK